MVLVSRDRLKIPPSFYHLGLLSVVKKQLITGKRPDSQIATLFLDDALRIDSLHKPLMSTVLLVN